MIDLHLIWGEDLETSTLGGLSEVHEPQLGTERVLRRLLTNPGAYVWHPEYGAGLAQYVGQPVDPESIQSVVLEQMRLEAAVAASPEPVVRVQSDGSGSLFLQVRYADANTADSLTLNIEIPR